MISKSVAASKIYVTFDTILHKHGCTSLDYLFKTNFALWMNHNTLTTDAYKV